MADGIGERTDEPALERAERAGLKLALKGRTAALVLIAAWFGFSTHDVLALRAVAIVLPFILLGIAHHALVGTRFDRWWLKYLFFTIDVLALGSIVAFGQLSYGGDVPQIIAFRAYGPYYAFIMLPLAALSLSPGLLVWTGAMICAAWWAAFLYVVSGMERTVSWGDLAPLPSAEQYLDLFLDPDFIGVGNRIEETVFIMLTALLLALAVHRARGAVRAHAVAERTSREVEQIFGHYVPPEVVRRLVRERATALAATRRDATVLFLDVQGFTGLAERMAPDRLIGVLSAFIDEATAVIGRRDGVVIDLIGDAVLATFNVPLDVPDHARKALDAGRDLLRMSAERRFDGVALPIRIGIASGPVAAGSVGGQRRSFTVYGDTVNLAQRLEQLNKERGTALLASAATAAATGEGGGLRPMGEVGIRGRERSEPVYALAPGHGAPEDAIPPSTIVREERA